MTQSIITRSRLIIATIALLLAFVANPCWAAQVQEPNVDPDRPIRLNFQHEEWSYVIPWFADQAGFALQPIANWPSGTFYLKDDSEYTTMEALDQLNHALRLLDPPYTLVRNRNMLVLTEVTGRDFPDELIEFVYPDELDQRGKYETIICIFDLGELNIDDMFEELAPLVSAPNRNFFAKLPAANQIWVRETGGVLRIMRSVIDRAHQNRQRHTEIYTLQYLDPESFMLMARSELGIPANRNSTPDESISITREPFGKKLFVRATQKMHDRFEEFLKATDVAVDTGEVQLRRMQFKQYPIVVDPELGYGMVEMVLEGRGARMQQDKLNNSIFVWGSEEDHALVAEALEAISLSSGQGFEIIPLEFGDAKTILAALQNLLRQTGTDVKPDAPVVIADADKNQIIVRGKQLDIKDITIMVEKLDAMAKSESNRSRTGTRMIDIDERTATALPDMIDYLLKSEGRPNKIKIVLPEDRKNYQPRGSNRPAVRGLQNGDSQTFEGNWGTDRRNPDDDQSSKGHRRFNLGTLMSASTLASSYLGVPSNTFLSSLVAFQPQQDEDERLIGRNSQSQTIQDEYRPPDAIESVAGAPIEIRFVNGKVILISEDLDALDDLEYAIRKEIGAKSEVEPFEVFAINHRSANEIKSVLEVQFGLASSNSGGGGSNPLGSMLGNLTPMGDIFGGLLGGSSGSSSTGASNLEGDVRFHIDGPMNYLFVIGATSNDLDQINAMVELLDQPNPAHDPNLVGRTYTIKIKHRDPEEIKKVIEDSIPSLIDKSSNEGNQGNNDQMAQLQRMMQQFAGGGRGGAGGGGGASQEQREAKCRLAVDVERSVLVVTGPNHIFLKIQGIVEELDIGVVEGPIVSGFAPRLEVDPAIVKMLLEQKFPGQFKFEQPETAVSNQAQQQARNRQGGGGGNAGAQQPQQPQQGRNADAQRMMEMMQRGAQQQATGNRGGGNRGGGGGQGGGGGNRGGGGGGGPFGGGGNRGGGGR